MALDGDHEPGAVKADMSPPDYATSTPTATDTQEQVTTEVGENRIIARTGRRKRPTVPFDERKRAKKACVMLICIFRYDMFIKRTLQANMLSGDHQL